MSYITDIPDWLTLPLSDWITAILDWLIVEGEEVFDAISSMLRWVLLHFESALLWMPWLVVVALFVAAAWRVGSVKMAAAIGASLVFIASLGMWELAMSTLALVLAATLISVLIGIPIGIVSARSDLLYSIVRPTVDLAQTMPSFVYLVPALMLFGLGQVPALVATVAYAVAPAIRLTNLGIRQVETETVEAALAFGATPNQLLRKVQLPLAWPTIMAGVNQTIMMALSMVVIASMIGAGGLGRQVLEGLSRLDVGKAFIGGVSITVLAIVIDRISDRAARPKRERARASGSSKVFSLAPPGPLQTDTDVATEGTDSTATTPKEESKDDA